MANANTLANSQTNSKKCCLCQKDIRKEDLISPPTHHVPKHDGCTMLATNVPLFYELDQMPMTLDLARLDEGGGIDGKEKEPGQIPK